ncbi:uncharacterized protein LOC128723903 [Anopheles nili]|uniref:uncharacterized protein LOC128723903 n=1 Tax=Anopheles nili TaxID=185578 RepID=UPI00237A78CB|nr:uncharacterized protein LOC128723903 [Anopheles nili]
MLLPDQTYEQANLRQERLRRSAAPYDDDDDGGAFPRLCRLQELYAGVGEELAGVLANNEMKFGTGASEDAAEGSSSGVGSSGDGGAKRTQGLDVRLPGGGKRSSADADSLWSGPAGSHTNTPGPGRCRSRTSQRAPPIRSKDQPTRSDQTDRGIGLDSASSHGSSLSYTSGSSDDEEGLPVRRRSAPPAPPENGTSRWTVTGTPGDDYDKTSDFFNNIPEFQGEALGPFSITGKRTEPNWSGIRTNVDVLRACELFLVRHRMRPDFFCKYKTAMNPTASAPASFPLSRARTPIDEVRKPKSLSPPMHRPASRATATLPAAGDRTGPIYSVPNRAGKKRRPNAGLTQLGH